MKKICFGSIFFLTVTFGFGQSWQDWEELYADRNIKVEIQFKVRDPDCQNGGRNSKFRYKITGSAYANTQHVYWKMKYRDCNDNMVVNENQIAIGGSDADVGIIESMEYVFLCKNLNRKFYDVSSKKKVKHSPPVSNRSQKSNRKNTASKPRMPDKAGYARAMRGERKKTPFKYCIQFGGGVQLNSDYSENGLLDPYVSAGLFRKVKIKKNISSKGRDNSRATLIGIFAEAGKFGTRTNSLIKNTFELTSEGFLRIEGGAIFREVLRLSVGVTDFNIDGSFEDFQYSGTAGLRLKLKKVQFDFNYVLLTDDSFKFEHSFFQVGAGISLNFMRKVPKWKKNSLKRQYSVGS